ncbi:MAG: RDD family protein [Bacteroidales bacterium]
MALGLKVTDMEGGRISFARATGESHGRKIISGMILYIGYILAGLTEKKQALHDMMAACLVVKKWSGSRQCLYSYGISIICF